MIKFNDFIKNYTIFFVVFTSIFFVPIFSDDIYYNFRFNSFFILNKYVFNILLVISLTFSFFIIKRFFIEFYILLFGSYFISWNLFLLLTNKIVTYNYFGLFIMLFSLILNLNINDCIKIFKIVFYILLFYSLSSLLFSLFGFSFFPIVNIRFNELSENSNEIRFVNSLLYGQSNAAGSAIYLMLNFLLLTKDKFKNINFIFYLLVLFILLITTASITGLILFLILFILNLIFFTKYLNFSKILILFISFFLFFYIFLNRNSLIYNIDSLLLKFDRISYFFNLIFSNPSYILFGYNINFSRYYDQFYTESSFLDFWLNFGFFGTILFIVILIHFISNFLKKKNYFGFFTILLFFILIFIQNSSMMPFNIIFLFLIGRISYQK